MRNFLAQAGFITLGVISTVVLTFAGLVVGAVVEWYLR